MQFLSVPRLIVSHSLHILPRFFSLFLYFCPVFCIFLCANCPVLLFSLNSAILFPSWNLHACPAPQLSQCFFLQPAYLHLTDPHSFCCFYLRQIIIISVPDQFLLLPGQFLQQILQKNMIDKLLHIISLIRQLFIQAMEADVEVESTN